MRRPAHEWNDFPAPKRPGVTISAVRETSPESPAKYRAMTMMHVAHYARSTHGQRTPSPEFGSGPALRPMHHGGRRRIDLSGWAVLLTRDTFPTTTATELSTAGMLYVQWPVLRLPRQVLVFDCPFAMVISLPTGTTRRRLTNRSRRPRKGRSMSAGGTLFGEEKWCHHSPAHLPAAIRRILAAY